MPSRVARDELRLKLRLERRLLLRLGGFFTALAREFRVGLLRGVVIDAQARGGAGLRRLLLEHYSAVAESFGGVVEEELPNELRLSDEERAELSAWLQEAFDRRATQQSSLILRSAQDDARRLQARADRQMQESPLEERAAQAATWLALRLASRARVASAYETQWSAEVTKIAEVTTLAGRPGGVEVKSLATLTKTWRSQGDSRVRREPKSKFDHLEADGQVVPLDQPFVVSGEQLMWPGDTSLGASLGNVINCRCSAIYDVPSIADLRRAIQAAIEYRPSGFDFVATESDVIVGAVLPGGGDLP